MKRFFLISLLFCFSIILFNSGCSKNDKPIQKKVTLQLNWLHDPTFTGEYIFANNPTSNFVIREGGPNIFPLAELTSGRADIALVGADIFLQALSNDYKENGMSDLVCIFVDFQRNPVGWILHPDTAIKAGINAENLSPKELNKLFFQKVANKTLQVGDKRGTETTSIWIQWKNRNKLPDDITVSPVGFDASIVLSAPMLAYPVYLNEEPFKLSEKIGRSVVVFDPAVDGVTVYGNVLVTTKAFINTHAETIERVQVGLKNSWKQVQKDIATSSEVVSKYYKGVSNEILKKQIEKTLEFVFYGGKEVGNMETGRSGRWGDTLNALTEAQLVNENITYEIMCKHIWESK